MPVTSTLVLDSAAIAQVLSSAQGPVARDLIRRGQRVVDQAKVNASGRPGPNVQTGRLRSSLHWRLVSGGGYGIFIEVGTTVNYACVFGAKTPVITERGLVGIGTLVPGDRVLTQAGDYRAVIALSSFPALEKPHLVEIALPWRNGADHKVTVTADHKILVYREGRNQWVMAGDIREGDEGYSRTKQAHNKGSAPWKTCEECGGRYQRNHSGGGGKRYCSANCRNVAWFQKGKNPHIGLTRSQEARAKMSRAAIARDGAGNMNRLMASKGFRTSCERQVEEWLIERGVRYECQYPIGGRTVDFFLPDTLEVLEADGAYWHRDQAADIERDKDLLAAVPGIEITHMHFYDQRFSPQLETSPLPGVNYVACNPGPGSFTDPNTFDRRPIRILGEMFYGQGKRHPQANYKRAHVWDVAVEGVHSFLASGIVVSNSYVEFGTSPTVIFPKQKQALYWRGAQHPVPYVIRQGNRPYPFLVPALSAAHGSAVAPA